MFKKYNDKDIKRILDENYLRHKMWDMQLTINRNLFDKVKKYETIIDNLMEEVFILMHPEEDIPSKLDMTGTLHLTGTGRF